MGSYSHVIGGGPDDTEYIPDVLEENVSGWIWSKDFARAVFVNGAERWEGGLIYIPTLQNRLGDPLVFEGEIYETESDALRALISHHDRKVERATARREAVARKLLKLESEAAR